MTSKAVRIDIVAMDKQTGFFHGPEYVRKYLASAALNQNDPMHDRFEWTVITEK